MPRKLRRKLLCFTKFKRPLAPESSSDDNYNRNQTNSTLVKRYNSLYHDDHNATNNDSIPKPLGAYLNSRPSSSSSSSSSSSEPDFSTIFASKRFFFSSPGRSNSIIESTTAPSSTNIATSVEEAAVPSSSIASEFRPAVDSCNFNDDTTINPPAVRDSVAVPTYSPDPYKDFRKSMQEMMEAHDLEDVQANWDSLHELLSCYLALNPESTHKYIIGAFSDLLVSLLSASTR